MSPTLDEFLENVRRFSAQEHYEQLYQFCFRNMEHLNAHSQGLTTALETLSYNEHSIGAAAILCQILVNRKDTLIEVQLHLVEVFFEECNAEQIMHATDIFAQLCHLYTKLLVDNDLPLRGIIHILKAISKLQKNPHQITSVHSDLAQLALLSKCLKPAVQHLDRDYSDIAQEHGNIDVKYFLQFFYYGGIIYTALKNFNRALYYFEVVLTTPSSRISAIMLEAYKKYVLVSLILHGHVVPLPKYTSQLVLRHVKPMSFAYNELAIAYSSNNIEELTMAVARRLDTYIRDTNHGLVKQCVASLHKKNIQRLTRTFLTLSLQDMAEKIRLPNAKQAEEYILKMIEDGEIFASINQKDGMVVFMDNPQKYNSTFALRTLESDMKECMQLEKKLNKMEQDIAKNPRYIQKTRGETE